MSLAGNNPLVYGARIAVWLVNDTPSRIVHHGTRYRVTDTPTRLEDDMGAITHPLPITGWRFQGTDTTGDSRMFDIIRNGDHWTLLRIYT